MVVAVMGLLVTETVRVEETLWEEVVKGKEEVVRGADVGGGGGVGAVHCDGGFDGGGK